MAINVLPHSIEAEQAVLASIINNPESISLMKETLHSSYFYNTNHKFYFQAFVDLANRNVNIDYVTLNEQLIINGKLETVGGIEYIANLAPDISIAVNAMEYANIVLEKFLIRETIIKAGIIQTEAYKAQVAEDVIELAQREISELLKLKKSDDFRDWNELIDEAHLKLNELISNEGTTIGLSTGFSNLDKLTNGLQKSDLIILAARPSVGKTAFALNLARNVAINNKGASVAVFSLEMGADQLLTRMLAAQSAVPLYNLKTGNLDAEETKRARYGLDKLREYNIHIDETAGIKINDLKSKCRKIKDEKGLDFIVIDYLQLITTSNPGIGRQQEVSEISRELKGLAKELQVPVLALSQLSRTVESRPDKKPMMSDIRESGAIEQDADIIMMLYRPEYYGSNIEMEESYHDGFTQLLVTKHRNGETGELNFTFAKEINRFKVEIPDVYEGV